jgi:predicted HD phosphohydrolase
MAKTKIPQRELTKIADQLLALNPIHGAVNRDEPVGIFKGASGRYSVQVPTHIDPDYFDTKEQAAERWLQLKIRGLI